MSNKDAELHKQAFELYTQGLSLEEIATQISVSPNTLRYWKSGRCKCTCGFHGWVSFKKKLQVQVPQTIVEQVQQALQPRLTAHQMIAVLETVCGEVLQTTQGGLRPRTWRELLETFRLILDLKKAYGPGEGDEFEISETRRITGKMDLHHLIDQFMHKVEKEKSASSTPDFVEELLNPPS